MDDIRGDFLGLPHGTTQAAVKSSEHINEKGDGTYQKFCMVHCFSFIETSPSTGWTAYKNNELVVPLNMINCCMFI